MRILIIILTLIVFFSISISSVYAPSTNPSDTPTLNDMAPAVSFVSFPVPVISSAVWDDADNGDEVLSAGDALTITFDIPTNRLGGTGTLAKGVVDNLFIFANNIGTDYTGVWTSTTVFTITIVNEAGATASIGDTVNAKATLQFTGTLDPTGGIQFGSIRSVATNSTGFIFVTDEEESNVQIFNPDLTFAGALDTTGGTAFQSPVGVATASNDLIYVSDDGANNVQIFETDGTFDGAAVNPCCGTIPFVNPTGVATNSIGHLFVSDPGAAPANVQEFRNGFFEGVLDTTGGTAFAFPQGIATNRTDFIFVSDPGAGNVQIFNLDGTFAGVVDTTGGTPFVNPTAVATNGTDFIFVSDSGANNVQIFFPNGTFAVALDTTGTTPFVNPAGVAIDSNDGLFVVDSSAGNVQKFTLGIRDSTSGSQPATGGITTTGNFGVIPVCTIETGLNVDTIISSSCTVTSSITAGGSVSVQSNAVMTIPDLVTLDINFATKNLTVESGSGVLIQSGGKIT